MLGIAESVYYGFNARRITGINGIAPIERRPDLMILRDWLAVESSRSKAPKQKQTLSLVQVARLHDVLWTAAVSHRLSSWCSVGRRVMFACMKFTIPATRPDTEGRTN